METLSAEQFKQKFGNDAVNSFKIQEKTGWDWSETGQDIMQVGSDIKESIKRGTTKQNEAMDRAIAGEQGAFRTTAQQIGIGFGTASNIFGDVFKGVVKSVMPQSWETRTKEGIKAVISPVMEIQIVKSVIQRYNNLTPKQKADVDAIIGPVSFGSDVVGLGVGAKVLKQGALSIGRTAQGAKEIISSSAGKTAQGAKEIVGKVGGVFQPTVKGIQQIPSRVATNIAETKAAEQTIKSLPTKVARTAARNGIDPKDVKIIYDLVKNNKEEIKTLWDSVKKYTSGKKVDPIEVVGKPITTRINQMNKEAIKIGQKLGDIANRIGVITKEELQEFVFNALKKVRGLEELSIGKKGKLDFSRTVLASRLSDADKRAIQEIYSEAIKTGTGKSKHLLRQELFEILGGKKRGMQVLTDTQDKAYEAVRKGLSDLLDIKNSSYKALNLKYAKTIQPVNELRRMLKIGTKIGNDVVNEDIIDMSAGLLARRLSSNAVSSSQVRAILRQMGIETTVDALQDMYNIFDRYYDLSRGTTLQKQVQLGIEKVGGIKNVVEEKIRELAGQTPAVQKKAIEDILRELLD